MEKTREKTIGSIEREVLNALNMQIHGFPSFLNKTHRAYLHTPLKEIAKQNPQRIDDLNSYLKKQYNIDLDNPSLKIKHSSDIVKYIIENLE